MHPYGNFIPGHNCILETKLSLADWAFHHHLARILMTKYIATEQLTAVVDARVDVTLMPHDDPEIS